MAVVQRMFGFTSEFLGFSSGGSSAKAGDSFRPKMLQGRTGANGGCGETLYPKNYEDIRDILRQAHDNASAIRVFGGTFPVTPMPDDILVDLRYVDRLIGLDIYQQKVTIESGMKLSVLNRILETVSLSLDLFGRIPDLTIVDAIATGLFGGTASLHASLVTCEVILSNGRVTTWTWDRNPEEMRAMVCGLGMTAVLISVTMRCIPLQRYTEISYLCSIRDVLEQWSIQMRSSLCQQLYWFPFSELTVLTHLNPTEKYHFPKQPLVNRLLERAGEFCSRSLRRVSLVVSSAMPLLASFLSRVQFFTHWSIAKYRSDYVHSIPRPWSSSEACRGTSWLIPLDRLPEVVVNISQWSHANPTPTIAPIFIQTLKMDPASAYQTSGLESPVSASMHTMSGSVSSLASSNAVMVSGGTLKKRQMQRRKMNPLLAPYAVDEYEEGYSTSACTVWYDWFVPEVDPDPIALADFEGIFHSVGGIRTWSGERLTSPLVLQDVYGPRYDRWCKVKGKLDRNNYLQSAYAQGTVWTNRGGKGGLNESTLSLCSSIVD